MINIYVRQEELWIEDETGRTSFDVALSSYPNAKRQAKALKAIFDRNGIQSQITRISINGQRVVEP